MTGTQELAGADFQCLHAIKSLCALCAVQVLRKQNEMLKEETELLRKDSQHKNRLLIEQQEQLRASEQQLQAALARLAQQQQQEVAAAGREAVQRQEQQQEQQQARAAAAAHVQHTQQEGSPPEQQQQQAVNAAQSAADQSDGELTLKRMQEAGQSDHEEVYEAGAAPKSLVHNPAGFIARQAQAETIAAHLTSAEHPASGVSAAAGRPENPEPGSADGEPATAHQLQLIALSDQVNICLAETLEEEPCSGLPISVKFPVSTQLG